IEQDESVRVLIVTGEGRRNFCAGADLTYVEGRTVMDSYELPTARIFNRLADLPIPTIAAINGAAVGGGLELALACDYRLAAEDVATMALPEITKGLIPAAGGARRLPAIIGLGRATEMVLGGKSVFAATALDWGLVTATHPSTVLLDAARHLGHSLAKRDRIALRFAKQALRRFENQFGTDFEDRLAQSLLTSRKDDLAVDKSTSK
ncbi:enoyl-CoA hydratase/isomerase family protein, partial [bacterium]|nr:enoyl-CoA hydratase/isomerase family protein [bacterium]